MTLTPEIRKLLEDSLPYCRDSRENFNPSVAAALCRRIDAAINETVAQTPCYSDAEPLQQGNNLVATPADSAGEDKGQGNHRVPAKSVATAPTPVAWMREWDGDVSDEGNMLYTNELWETQDGHAWCALYPHDVIDKLQAELSAPAEGTLGSTQAGSTPAPAAAAPCSVDHWSSRICEAGTKGCNVWHLLAAAPIRTSASWARSAGDRRIGKIERRSDPASWLRETENPIDRRKAPAAEVPTPTPHSLSSRLIDRLNNEAGTTARTIEIIGEFAAALEARVAKLETRTPTNPFDKY